MITSGLQIPCQLLTFFSSSTNARYLSLLRFWRFSEASPFSPYYFVPHVIYSFLLFFPISVLHFLLIIDGLNSLSILDNNKLSHFQFGPDSLIIYYIPRYNSRE